MSPLHWWILGAYTAYLAYLRIRMRAGERRLDRHLLEHPVDECEATRLDQ